MVLELKIADQSQGFLICVRNYKVDSNDDGTKPKPNCFIVEYLHI